MNSRFNNSKGLGFVGFVIIIGLVLLGLVAAVFGSLRASRQEAAQFRKGTSSLLVLQQLGTVALKAHNDHVSDPTCSISGGYPVGAEDGGTGPKAFCVPNEICVSDPDENGALICAGGSQNEMRMERMRTGPGIEASLDFNIKYRSEWQKWKYAYFDFVLKTEKVAKGKLGYFSNVLQAQTDIPFDFTVGTRPIVNINDICGGSLCKTCAPAIAGAYPVNQVPCLRFRVCPKMIPCNPGIPSEWMVQKIGIIQNAPNPAAPF